MSTNYVTPGRRSGSLSAVNGTGNSSSKRVVRSALEVLMDTASPEIGVAVRSAPLSSPSPRAPSPAPVPPSSTGFTVTYATAAPVTAATTRRPSPASADTIRTEHRKTGAPRVVREEPSALAFLSPPQEAKRRARSTGHDVASEKTSRVEDHSRPRIPQPRPHSAPRTIVVSSPPETSRNLYEEVELASADAAREPPAPRATKTVSFSSSHDDDGGSSSISGSGRSRATLDDEEAEDGDHGALYTEDELMTRVEEMLTAYEQQRDDEETAVLEQVAEEIEHHKARYDALRAEHTTITAAHAQLQTRMQESDSYARTLEQKLAALHSSSQSQRERADRLEVALRHEQDAKRLPSPPSVRDTAAASARLAELEAQLAAKDTQLSETHGQIAQLTAAAEQHAREKWQFEQDCEAIKSRVVFFSERMAEMETVLREKNGQLQRAQRQLADARAEQQQLKRQAAETPSVNDKLAELQSHLQQQTDEVRRRMHRITVLEREKAALADETHGLRRAVCSGATHQKRLEATLDKVVRTLRLYTRKPQLWLLPASSPSTTSGPRGTQTFFSVNGLADALMESTSSNASSSELNEGSERQVASDEDEPYSAAASSYDDEGTKSPVPRSRARSSPSTRATAETMRGGSRRARTISPQSSRPTTTSSSSPQKEEITKKRSKAGVSDMRASQSECLRVAQEMERQVATLHAKTQSYIARLQRKHAQLIASSAETAAHAATSTGASPMPPAAAPKTDGAVALQRRLEDGCRALKAALEAKSAEFEEVQTECRLRGDDLQLLERHVHELQRQLATRDTQDGASQASIAKMEEELLTLRAAVAAGNAEIEARAKECARVGEALATAQRELTEAERVAQVRAAEWQEKHSLAVARVKRLEEEKAALEAVVAEGKERTRELQGQLQGVRSQQAAARQRGGREQREMTQDLGQLRQQLASVTALHEANKTQLEKERSESASRETNAQRQQDKLQMKLGVLKQQLMQLANEHALRCSGEQGMLTTLLDMLRSYSVQPVETDGGASPPIEGTRLFQPQTDVSDLLADSTHNSSHVNALLNGHSPATPAALARAEADAHASAAGATTTMTTPSLGYVTRCRGEVVCRVQRVLLELTRLQMLPRQQQQQPEHGQRTASPSVKAAAERSPVTSHSRGSPIPAETEVDDDKELVMHGCSVHDECDNHTDDDNTFVDDDFLKVLQQCCRSTSSPLRDDDHAHVKAASSTPRGSSPPFLRERPLNAPPPLPKSHTKPVMTPAAQTRAPHAHLLRGHTDGTVTPVSSMAAALRSQSALSSSPSAFAPHETRPI